MPYTINKYSGEQLVVLEDGTIDTSTSIGLVGRNYVGYGETQNENFVYLLENFANEFAPSRPLAGQTWFDTSPDAKILNVYDGASWHPVGNAIVSKAAPENPSTGQLWIDSDTNQLFVFSNSEWRFVGPEGVENFGITRARSTSLYDSDNILRPVILITVNDTVIGIVSGTAFTIRPDNGIIGFSILSAGLTLNSATVVKGDLVGNASSATQLETARKINNVGFDGRNDITITANTHKTLLRGSYLTGSDFNGSTETTWAVDASSSNQPGKVVARNAAGGFSAGVISADLAGNVTASSGTSKFDIIEANRFVGATLTGNAYSATKLQTARKINEVEFDGTQDVTVPASALTLTETTINPGVKFSSLEKVGTLIHLNTTDAGINIGNSLSLSLQASIPTIESSETNGLLIKVKDSAVPGLFSDIALITSAQSLSASGINQPAFAPNFIHSGSPINLGTSANKWDKIYANRLVGNADTATLAVTSVNLQGGGAGAIPYQTSAGTTAFVPPGSPGYVLKAGSENTISWEPVVNERLTAGNHIVYSGTGTPSYYDTNLPLTISVDAVVENVPGKVVSRDEAGNFAAGTITANLNGNASTASRLQTARTINGVAFDGSSNITIQAVDPSKVAKAGDTMTGFLTLNGWPTNPLHATPKSYVDSRLPRYNIVSGASYSTSGYTNQVGSFNYGANFFDVFPPAGLTMANLVAFIPSIHMIHFNGGVNGDDSLMNTYEYLGDRIRVRVQNTEQRYLPAANYLAIWGY